MRFRSVLLAAGSLLAAVGLAGVGSAAQPAKLQPTAGQKLFSQHCAGCHGEAGDGKGAAATFLFPKPRDFQGGKYKLVSTENSVPSPADLEAVLVRGMPGSSMPSWAHLSRDDRQLLIDEIYRLTGEGARLRYIKSLQDEQGLAPDDLKAPDVQEEISAFAKNKTTPSETAAIPAIAAPSAAAVVRGKEHFIKAGCASCHGNEGKGDGVKQMFDDDGFATRPRDLTRGIYKGGHDPASLYLRIARGMPGTPMPSAPTLTEPQVIDLIHFLRSLSDEKQRESTVLRRQTLVASRVSELPTMPADARWASAAAVSVQTFPLWWRDDAEPHLSVQAVHDGKAIAVRLVWNDPTQNARAVAPDEFEDAAAIQLYQGKAEAFLGMGAKEGSIDLWLWRGGRYATGAEDSLLDDYPFDAPIYHELAKAQGKTVPDFIAARAAANQVTVRDTSAQELAARGPGSSTFAPRPSQAVKAHATWENGRWSVVLTRPLAAADAGLVLGPGQETSIAFAIWDGAFRDRAGQKLISIWNDLKLE